MRACMQVCTYVRARMFFHIYVYIYIHIYACVCVCIYIYVRACVSICIFRDGYVYRVIPRSQVLRR